MAVFRVERNTGYTVMSNHHLRNKELSLKAKGLLSQMLSLPEDWDYTLAGLSYINRESIDANCPYIIKRFWLLNYFFHAKQFWSHASDSRILKIHPAFFIMGIRNARLERFVSFFHIFNGFFHRMFL